MRRLAEAGLRPDTRHGQNFLIDLNLLDVLVRTADIGPSDVVLEIGTGMGSLTARLAERAAAVVTVEIDPRLAALAAEELSGRSNVTMLVQDALKNKHTLHPQVLAALRQQLAAHPGSVWKLVANLPYNAATPILSNLLEVEPPPASLTATIQKELAERITAPPGTKEYSALSVWIQAQCAVRIVRLIPPQAFWPRPKVHSAILQIVPHPARRRALEDPGFFHDLVRTLFCHRRKYLRGVLASALQGKLPKAEVEAIVNALNLAPDARAEQLDVPTLIALAHAVRRALTNRPPGGHAVPLAGALAEKAGPAPGRGAAARLPRDSFSEGNQT
jgi:16S rRNA (adenine1518-N6/adenine1519-N6)-dimethyltransferase